MSKLTPATSQRAVAFISYRHGDGAGYPLLLHRELADYYGGHKIFIDIDIEPGEDWVEVIERAIESSDALVAVIGKVWLTTAIKGRRRLDDPDDRLRLEIVTALDRNIKVFPLLVDGAEMPTSEELPVPMARLARRQAIEVRSGSWSYDFGRLISALDNVIAARATETNPPSSSRHRAKPSFISLDRFFHQFKRKHVSYWLRVVVLILAGLFLGDRAGKQQWATQARSQVLHSLQAVTPRSSFPRQTTLVLIGDEEYWGAELEGRVPIRRDYLARVIEALDRFQPRVIALNFNLRSPSAAGSPVEFAQYRAETEYLLDTIRKISAHGTTVVLPTTLDFGNGSFVEESAIYSGVDFDSKVRTGFIELPDDVRTLPLTLTLDDGRHVDSFARAILREYPNGLDNLDGNASISPYATYLEPKAFQAVSTGKLLSGNADMEDYKGRFAGKIIIVGGNWHVNGRDRGPIVASYDTPVGVMSGAFIQANYVEALLDNRIYQPIKSWVILALQFFLCLVVAAVFALAIHPQFKLASIILLSWLLIAMSYFSWQALDLLFSLSLPVILLAASLVVDQVLEWRALAQARYREASLS